MVIKREQNMVNCINTEVRVSFYHFGDLHWKPSSSSKSSNKKSTANLPTVTPWPEVKGADGGGGWDTFQRFRSFENLGIRARSRQLWLVVGFFHHPFEAYEI